MKGERASPEEATILTLAPHSSYFDALPVVNMDLSSCVAKAESSTVLLFGSMTWFYFECCQSYACCFLWYMHTNTNTFKTIFCTMFSK